MEDDLETELLSIQLNLNLHVYTLQRSERNNMIVAKFVKNLQTIWQRDNSAGSSLIALDFPSTQRKTFRSHGFLSAFCKLQDKFSEAVKEIDRDVPIFHSMVNQFVRDVCTQWDNGMKLTNPLTGLGFCDFVDCKKSLNVDLKDSLKDSNKKMKWQPVELIDKVVANAVSVPVLVPNCKSIFEDGITECITVEVRLVIDDLVQKVIDLESEKEIKATDEMKAKEEIKEEMNLEEEMEVEEEMEAPERPNSPTVSPSNMNHDQLMNGMVMDASKVFTLSPFPADPKHEPVKLPFEDIDYDMDFLDQFVDCPQFTSNLMSKNHWNAPKEDPDSPRYGSVSSSASSIHSTIDHTTFLCGIDLSKIPRYEFDCPEPLEEKSNEVDKKDGSDSESEVEEEYGIKVYDRVCRIIDQIQNETENVQNHINPNFITCVFNPTHKSVYMNDSNPTNPLRVYGIDNQPPYFTDLDKNVEEFKFNVMESKVSYLNSRVQQVIDLSFAVLGKRYKIHYHAVDQLVYFNDSNLMWLFFWKLALDYKDIDFNALDKQRKEYCDDIICHIHHLIRDSMNAEFNTMNPFVRSRHIGAMINIFFSLGHQVCLDWISICYSYFSKSGVPLHQGGYD